jgi:hypothetical protein
MRAARLPNQSTKLSTAMAGSTTIIPATAATGAR